MEPLSPSPSRWLVLAAAEIEVDSLRRAHRGPTPSFDILVAGVGRAGDGPVRRALARHRGAVLNLGFAGALAPELDPGSVVLTTAWIDPDTNATVFRPASGARATVRSWLTSTLDPVEAPSVTVEAPFHDAERGRRLHRQAGAATVEMEGARWAMLAAEVGCPMVAVRVVSDRADLPLPLPRHRLLTATSGIRWGTWLRARPRWRLPAAGELRNLLRARRDWRAALSSLRDVSGALAAGLSAAAGSH